MTQPPILRGLDAVLSTVDNGNYYPDLIERHAALIAELQDFSSSFGGVKASGSLTLTINYTTDRFGQIEVSIEDKIKTPKPPKAKGNLWALDGGALTVANPNQTRMEIRDVGGTRELRTPGATA